MSSSQHDVIVIGAGIAGLSAARWRWPKVPGLWWCSNPVHGLADACLHPP